MVGAADGDGEIRGKDGTELGIDDEATGDGIAVDGAGCGEGGNRLAALDGGGDKGEVSGVDGVIVTGGGEVDCAGRVDGAAIEFLERSLS